MTLTRAQLNFYVNKAARALGVRLFTHDDNVVFEDNTGRFVAYLRVDHCTYCVQLSTEWSEARITDALAQAQKALYAFVHRNDVNEKAISA